jgi:hypothetical protein
MYCGCPTFASRLSTLRWEATNCPATGIELLGEEGNVACPYFIPDELCAREPWPHRERLPLGDGFAGRCGAQLPESRCDDQALRQHCNLGYADIGYANVGAAPCPHLPTQRDFDAVRFTVQSKSPVLLRVQFACERSHLPALSGELHYDRASMTWQPPPDARLLQLAQAAVRAWMASNEAHAGPIAAP